MRTTRREFLASSALLATRSFSSAAELPPVRTITRGPKFHWFGYYDKLEFDPSSRYVLGMEVDFEGRSPKPDDTIRIGMVDLQDGDRWIELGESKAWCWQQGCMLQWRPGSKTEIVWNDRQDGQFVCHLLDTVTGKRRTVPQAIYALSPDGKTAVTADFRRLNDTRPGYGYVGIPDPATLELAPKESGIWTINLETGQHQLILPLAEVARFGTQTDDMRGAKHWFNHLLFSTDGRRFVFLHRWKPTSGKTSFRTRMITANLDGTDLFVLDPSGNTSHFIWRDPHHIAAWTKPDRKPAGFYLFHDRTTEVEPIGAGVMTENGHNTYLPGNEWILNDTYPDKARLQHVYLYHVKTGSRVALGDFHSPPDYTGEWRCDTHPRFSPDGKSVVIDSPHTGGRQLHLIDISKIVG